MGPADAIPPDPPALVAPSPPSSVETRLGELSVQGFAGVRSLSVGALDAPLRANGYGSLPREYAGGGFALDLSFARWRFELQMLYTSSSAPSVIDSSPGVGAAVGDLGLCVGYDVLRWRGLTGFVMGGFGYSALMLDAHDPHWSYVTTQTGVGSDVTTVEQDVLTYGMQAGLQQIIPFGSGRSSWGLVFSLRGGLIRQFGDVGWMETGSSKPLGGMPDGDLSGGWLAFGAGFVWFGSPVSGSPLARWTPAPE
jgi:hypothetical protein